MLSLLAPAAAASLLLMAILIWKRLAFPGHGELALSLAFGALFFLYRADSVAFAWLQPVLCAGPLACNRAIRAGFEVGRRSPSIEGLVLVVLVASGVYGYAGHVVWAARVFDVVSLGLFFELPLVVWRGLPDDLVAARRQARLWCLAIGAGLSLLIAVASVFGHGALAVTAGAAAVILLCWGAVAFGDRVFGAVVPQPKALDHRDSQVLRRLRGLMRDEMLYRDPNVTLSRLAQRLDVPEHRLRRVIHVGEGQRNFSAWLNGWRIGEIKAALDDPSREDSLLNLAMAAGYNSLSAFNRAFKAVEGMTPSAYRAARTAKTVASARNSPDVASDTTTP